MKKFLQKQKEILIISAYMLIVAGIVYFAILPLLKSITNIKDQIQEEAIKQEIIRGQLEELPKIQEQYDMLQKNEGLDDVLFDKNDAITLIKKLETLSQISGNKIEISVQENAVVQPVATKNISNSLVGSLPNQDYMQMKLSLTGKYSAIADFIRRLENSEYYCDIIAINIKKAENNNSQSSTIGLGMLNIFNSASRASVNNLSANNNGNITADLDVVFYAKK
jgi:hypothetical protein